ncbi:hypothetical protein CVT26_005072 [Gymnopilus dilepis]|uniref:Uncharacterized protein n=1 Tax=Gymnopilus dilepis TaxID=231916 RepID=A0A409W878_9AGAR|nr:hypothetical protein CVT26_005072 [Gymnopilus dilepis]
MTETSKVESSKTKSAKSTPTSKASSATEANEGAATRDSSSSTDPPKDDGKEKADHESSLYKFLEKWQSTCLLEHQLTFTEAIESLNPKSKKRLIEARAGTGNRANTWTLFDTRTNQEAILVHTAIWRSNTSFDTGNFAPPGQKPPIHVSNQRIQRAPGFKCEITYTIDTTVEDSFYTNLQILEEYIQTIKGFNRENKERSPWQDGTHRDTYDLTSKLFVRTSLNTREPTFKPHKWLIDVVNGQKKVEYAINPRRPSYFDLVDKKVVKLEKSKPPRYCAGDIIWFSFKASFYIGNQYWSSALTPVEFVRVARGIKYGLNNPEDDDDEETEGAKKRSLEDGSAISMIERNPFEDQGSQKRKRDEASEDEKGESEGGSETADEEESSISELTEASVKEELEVTEAALPEPPAPSEPDPAESQPPPKKKGKKSKN